MSEIVDMKLTRGEVIELIIEEIHEELAKAMNGVKAEMRSLGDPWKPELTQEFLARVYNGGEVSLDSDGEQEDETFTVTITCELPFGALPNKTRHLITKERELQEQLGELRHRRNMLEAKGAKNAALRVLLSRSAEGAELLNQLEAVRKVLSPKLFPKLFPQLTQRP